MKFLKGELNLPSDVNFKFYFKGKSPQRDGFLGIGTQYSVKME